MGGSVVLSSFSESVFVPQAVNNKDEALARIIFLKIADFFITFTSFLSILNFILPINKRMKKRYRLTNLVPKIKSLDNSSFYKMLFHHTLSKYTANNCCNNHTNN